MIKAKKGVVKVTGYTHELMKEMVGIIDAALEKNFFGETVEKREAMLNMIIKMVKCKISGKDPMEAVDDMDKDEVVAFMRLMAAINIDDGDDDDEEESDSGDAHGNVTVICGGKKVVTDADGIGKIIADMVTEDIRNSRKEKQ